MLKLLLILPLLLSVSAFADSGRLIKLNPILIFDNQAVRTFTKSDEAVIQTALRLIEAFPPAAAVIFETEPKIFVTKTDSAWTEENLTDMVPVGITMKLLDPRDPYRIVLFWDRVKQDPYPILRVSLSFLEIFNEINPLKLRLPGDVLGENLQRIYRRIEFLGQTQLSNLYRRLDVSSKFALNQYLEIFQAQLRAQMESQRAIRKTFFDQCGRWLN